MPHFHTLLARSVDRFTNVQYMAHKRRRQKRFFPFGHFVDLFPIPGNSVRRAGLRGVWFVEVDFCGWELGELVFVEGDSAQRRDEALYQVAIVE